MNYIVNISDANNQPALNFNFIKVELAETELSISTDIDSIKPIESAILTIYNNNEVIDELDVSDKNLTKFTLEDLSLNHWIYDISLTVLQKDDAELDSDNKEITKSSVIVIENPIVNYDVETTYNSIYIKNISNNERPSTESYNVTYQLWDTNIISLNGKFPNLESDTKYSISVINTYTKDWKDYSYIAGKIEEITDAIDNTIESFEIPNITNAELNSTKTTDEYVISGINAPVNVSTFGIEKIILNGQDVWISTVVKNGDKISFDFKTSSDYNITKLHSVDFWEYKIDFSSITKNIDNTIEEFEIPDLFSNNLYDTITTDEYEILGINVPIKIKTTNIEKIILNGEEVWTSVIVKNGDKISFKFKTSYSYSSRKKYSIDFWKNIIEFYSTTKSRPYVAPVNTAPTANNDISSTAYNTSTLVDVLSNDTDSESSVSLTWAISNQVWGSFTVENGQIKFTPTNGFTGTASASYEIQDSKWAKDTATVSINVSNAPNTAPTVSINNPWTATVGQEIIITATASDSDGSISSYEWKVDWVVIWENSSSLGYTPSNSWNKNIICKVIDNDWASNTDDFSLNVEEANTAPTAQDKTVDAMWNDTVSFDMNSIIWDAETVDADLNIEIVSWPTHWALTWTGHSFEYEVTDWSWYIWSDNFTYKVKDSWNKYSEIKTITIKDVMDT